MMLGYSYSTFSVELPANPYDRLQNLDITLSAYDQNNDQL